MLISYSIRDFNFFSSKHTISFKAKNLKNDEDSSKHRLLDNEVLPVIGIFGDVMITKLMFFCLINYFLNFLKINEDKKESREYSNRYSFSSQKGKLNKVDEGTEWTIIIKSRKTYYQYQFCIKEKNEVAYESLSKSKNLNDEWTNIFTREKDKPLKLSKDIDNLTIKPCASDEPLLTYLYLNANLKEIKDVYNEIKNIHIIDAGICELRKCFNENHYYYDKNDLCYKLDFHARFLCKNKKIFLKIFNDLGLDYIDMQFDPGSSQREWLILMREPKDDDKNNGITIFEDEPKEIQDIIAIMTEIVRFLMSKTENAILFINNIDFFVDSNVLNYIIKLFDSDFNSNNSQLIIGADKAKTLNKKNFRKDEVYFIANNNGHSSVFVCLNDVEDINDPKWIIKENEKNTLIFEKYIKKIKNW